MKIALVFGAGAVYAAALWFIASWVARRRDLALGSVPYWLVVLCGGAAVGVDVLGRGPTELLVGTSLIGAIVCGLVDARTGFIFDALSFTMVLVACAVGLLDGRLADGAIAAGAVGGALAALYLITGRRGIGLGDVKLGSAIALGYGFESAIVAIGSAFILGAAYALVLIGSGRAKRSDALRFGPFIAAGAAVSLTAGALGWPG